MHEGWKEKHTEGKYNRDLSSQIWVSYISDINKIFLLQDMCEGASTGRGSWRDCRRALFSPVCRPDTVFYPQLRMWEELITGRHAQFKSFLWRENLINIITNEMERGEQKDCFHLLVEGAGWSVSRRRRNRELASWLNWVRAGAPYWI